MNPVSQELGPCPCRAGLEEDFTMSRVCEMVGTKLTKYGHLVGCTCRSCMGRRSKRSGQRKQSLALKAAAAAQGERMDVAPTHEEQARLLVHYEIKSGDQAIRPTPAERAKWEKQAQDAAEKNVPPRKWAVVTIPPGPPSAARITMPWQQWLSLVTELMESV